MDSLPEHILTRIFYFTSESPQFLLTNISPVCKSFRSAIFRPQLWRNLHLVMPENPDQLESLRSFLRSTDNGNIGSWLRHLSFTYSLLPEPYAHVYVLNKKNPNEIDAVLPLMENLESLTIDLSGDISIDYEESSLVRLTHLCPSLRQIVMRMNFPEERSVINPVERCLVRMATGWPKLDTIVAPFLLLTELANDEMIQFSDAVQSRLQAFHVGLLCNWRNCDTKEFLNRHRKTLKSVANICCSTLPAAAQLVPQLEELCLNVRTFDTISVLTQFECLKFLSLRYVHHSISPIPIVEVFRSGKLCNLRAIDINNGGGDWLQVKDAIAQHCPNLEAADFGTVSDREEADMIISRCKNLVILKFYLHYRPNSLDDDGLFDSIPTVNLPKLQLLNCYFYKVAFKDLIRRTPGLVVQHSCNGSKEKMSTCINGDVVSWEYLDGYWVDRLQRKWNWPPLTVGKFLSKHCHSGF